MIELAILAALGVAWAATASVAYSLRGKVLSARSEAAESRYRLHDTEAVVTRLVQAHASDVALIDDLRDKLRVADKAALLGLKPEPEDEPFSERFLRHAHRFEDRDDQGVLTCKCGDRYLDEIRG